VRLDPLDARDERFDPEDEYRPEPPAEPVPPAWVDGSLRIGIHTSISGSYLNALESARRLGCNALQIFSASPRMWSSGPSRIPDSDAAAFRVRRGELGLGPLVIHANYLINLAGMQPMLRTRSIQAFHDDLVAGDRSRGRFSSGASGRPWEAKIEVAVATIIESVKQAVRRIQLGKLRILVENTAGMGTAVGSRLEKSRPSYAGFPRWALALASIPRTCLQQATTSARKAASKRRFRRSSKPLAWKMFACGT